jgi:uncharacterized protein YcfJ
MKSRHLLWIAAAGLLASTAVASAASVTAATDLNVRAGPGPQHPVIGVLGAGQAAQLDGCIASGKWCQINGEGWVYSAYLLGDSGGKQVLITEQPAGSVAVIDPDRNGGGTGGAVTGAVVGGITGAIIGGPVGAAIGAAGGGIAGGTIGQTIDPPEQVRTYVTSQRMDPVYLEGEVVVGATLPENVEFRTIPDYEYRYTYVNGQAVLVEPSTRRIVYVVR